jgi:hypothetical protein
MNRTIFMVFSLFLLQCTTYKYIQRSGDFDGFLKSCKEISILSDVVIIPTFLEKTYSDQRLSLAAAQNAMDILSSKGFTTGSIGINSMRKDKDTSVANCKYSIFKIGSKDRKCVSNSTASKILLLDSLLFEIISPKYETTLPRNSGRFNQNLYKKEIVSNVNSELKECHFNTTFSDLKSVFNSKYLMIILVKKIDVMSEHGLVGCSIEMAQLINAKIHGEILTRVHQSFSSFESQVAIINLDLGEIIWCNRASPDDTPIGIVVTLENVIKTLLQQRLLKQLPNKR